MEKFTYTLTSSQDEILTDMISFFFDQGLPPSFNSDAFDSLADQVLCKIPD